MGSFGSCCFQKSFQNDTDGRPNVLDAEGKEHRIMTRTEFDELSYGDIVRSQATGVEFMVQFNYGGRVTAVRTADMTNPSEWDLISKVTARDSIGPISSVSEPTLSVRRVRP